MRGRWGSGRIKKRGQSSQNFGIGGVMNILEEVEMAARRISLQPLSSVLVVGSSDNENAKLERLIKAVDFVTVQAAPTLGTASQTARDMRPALVLVEDVGGQQLGAIVDFVTEMRSSGYGGYFVVLTDDPTFEEFLAVLRAGVDDYWFIGPHLNLAAELIRLLSAPRGSYRDAWCPDVIGELGFFRTLGLNRTQTALLVEYARDFPQHRELAKRLGTSETYLRRTFSNIYARLKNSVAVENQAQLAALLSICAVYA